MKTEQKQPTIKDVIIKPIKDSGMRDTSEGKPKFQYIDSLFLEEVMEKAREIVDEDYQHYRTSCEKVFHAISFEDPYYNEYHRMLIITIAATIIITFDLNEDWEKQVPYRGLLKFALFMEAGAKKYSFENWKLLNTPEDIKRFKESCYRHYVQWRLGENDEDHQMATVFNLMALYYHTQPKEEE